MSQIIHFEFPRRQSFAPPGAGAGTRGREGRGVGQGRGRLGGRRLNSGQNPETVKIFFSFGYSYLKRLNQRCNYAYMLECVLEHVTALNTSGLG